MKIVELLKSHVLLLCILLIFSLVLARQEVGAATYYVAPTGNDRNSGSQSAPFKTIQKAADVVNPGDTVIVKDGTYTDIHTVGEETQNLRIRRSGTASNWITFKAENTWGAKINGQNSVDFCVMVMYPVSYVRLEGFEIYNCCMASKDRPSGDGVFINTDIQSNCSSSHAHDIYLYKLKIHDICRVRTNDDHGEAGVDGDQCAGSGTVIDSCIFYNIGRLNPYTTPSAPESSCTGSSVFCYNHDPGIYLRGGDYTIINNIFYPDFKSGWPIQLWSEYGDMNNIKIINNTFYGANPQRNAHILMAGSGDFDNILIQNNIFHSPTSYAISNADNANNVTVRNNLAYGASLIGGSGCSDPDYTCSGNITGRDPKFVNLGTHDFHLQAGSPAIGGGLSFSGRTKDADGNSIVGVPDIGAYEAGGVSEDTIPPAPPAIIEVK